MGRGEIIKKQGDKLEATLCPQCSYEHVVVPMFRIKKDEFHCLLCKQSFIKRVNGRTLYLPVNDPEVEFEADFEV